jgi:hypothetical protein
MIYTEISKTGISLVFSPNGVVYKPFFTPCHPRGVKGKSLLGPAWLAQSDRDLEVNQRNGDFATTC